MFFVLTILQQGKLVSVPLCGWCPLASVKAIPIRSGMEPRQSDPQILQLNTTLPLDKTNPEAGI